MREASTNSSRSAAGATPSESASGAGATTGGGAPLPRDTTNTTKVPNQKEVQFKLRYNNHSSARDEKDEKVSEPLENCRFNPTRATSAHALCAGTASGRHRRALV